ncbi:MAG: DoxX family membrane protein [Ignavibacteria bacterium]|nr:DoxX family membrane protein [Ignavibacteria bacterium]
MDKEKILQVANLILRIFIGFILIYASIGKIEDPNLFAKEISNYRLLPEFLSKTIAIILPWIELTLGVLLIFGIRIQTSSFLTFLLFTVFTAGILSALARGLNINCGCFAYSSEPISWKKILENFGLILATIYLFLFPKTILSLENLNKDLESDR